jgi:uncharacterized protein (TIRG00374 family)
MGRSLAIAIGVGLSGVCLALAISWVSWSEFSAAFQNLSYEWLVLAALLQLSTLILRAYRWQMMFLQKPRYDILFWTQAVGYLANNLLPLRLGDVARIIVLRLAISASSFRIGYTIVVERYLDIAMTLVLLVLAASFARISEEVWIAAAVFLAIMLLASLSGAGLYFYGRAKGEGLATPLLKKTVTEFVYAIDTTFRNRPGTSLSLSAAGVAFSTLMVWAVLKGFNPGATPWTAMLMTVTITFALAIPSAPANLGTFQLAGQAALVSLFGERYTPAAALAIVSVIHVIHFTGTTLLGAIGVWWLRRQLGNKHLLGDLIGKLLRPTG